MSNGEMVPVVSIDRRPPERAQRVVARAKKGSASRRRKVKALAREWERTRTRERNTLHGISASIVKRHSRIAVEDLQVSNMLRRPMLARPMAERQWGWLVHQLTCRLRAPVGKSCGSVPSTPARTAMPAGTGSRCRWMCASLPATAAVW